MRAAFLQRQQLLGTESLVVDLRGGFDEVLEMGAEHEVAQEDEFAVVLVLDVDDAPAVLATSDLLAIDDDVLLRSDNRKRNQVLDLLVQNSLLVIKLLIIVREHLEVVEGKLGLNTLLEFQPLLGSQGVGLGNDRHNIDNIGQLLQDDDINWLEGVSGRLDEEQTAVDARVGDVALSLSGKLLSQVRRVLVLDILDDGIPAAVVVDEIAITRSIDNVEPQPDTVLLDEVRDPLNLSGGADGLVGLQTALRVNEVRSKDGVDKRRLAQAGLANANNIELETALQELALNL